MPFVALRKQEKKKNRASYPYETQNGQKKALSYPYDALSRHKNKRFMKKKIIFAGLVVLLFVGTFWFLWMKSQPQPVQYTELVACVKNLRKTTVITGRIEPRNEVNVKPQISGIITHLLKEAGETVQAGEVIARVKVIPDMGQLSAAQARVRLASVNLQQARIDHERQRQLFDKGLVSADEYDKIHQAYRQAREEAAAAEDNLQVVRDGVSKANAKASSTLIRSTITGVILDIPVKVGNSVILSNTFNDGTTIASVANMHDLIFKGNIDETEVGRLRPGMTLQITVGALQNLRFTARLEYISPKAVESNGANQFEIKAAVQPREDGHIRSGYSANAEIVLAEARGALTIPESAVEFVGKEAFVYVAKGTGKTLTYERRRVSLGLSDGIDIEIKSGLKAGEKVRGPKQTVPSAS